MSRVVLANPLSPPWREGDLPSGWRAAALLACALAGLAASLAPMLPLLVILGPIVVVAALRAPETVFVLFLTAGVYKQDPRLAVLLPVDVTVLMGGWLALALVLRGVRRGLHVPPAAWLLLPLVAAVLFGLARGPVPYGAEKAVRFCTLTLLAIVASLALLRDRAAQRKFFLALAVVAVLLGIYAAQSPDATTEGRLTLQGSSPISLGRLAAVALAFGWLQYHFQRRAFERVAALGVLALSSYCVLASGSRGPVLSFLASMMLVAIVSFRRHGKSPVSLRVVLVVGVFAAVIVAVGLIPAMPLQRFQLLVSENKGTSIFLRGVLFATAWKLMLTHPLGLGIGGFSKYAVLDLRYPHNLFLEVGSELGWLPLAALVVLVIWSLRCVVQALQAEYSWTAQFMAIVVLTALLNSMVTGDLNDNRILFACLLLPFLFRRTQAQAVDASVPPARAAAPPGAA